MVSRLTTQKGIDLVAGTLDAVVTSGARLVVLGAGETRQDDAMRAGAARHPSRVAVHIGHDEAKSHPLQGGCDAILVPSRLEPCSLTQLYGLLEAVGRMPGMYRQPLLWRRMQNAGMKARMDWQSSAAEYAVLYWRLSLSKEPA